MNPEFFALLVAIIALAAVVVVVLALKGRNESMRVNRLEDRVAHLESRLAATERPPEPKRAAPPVQPVPPLPPVAAKESWPGMEAQIAGSWLNRIGIIAMLLAVAFFLKYAFDNDWIGPTGRISIGIMAGVALLVWSETLLKRQYTYFSEGIAGLGAGAIYLSLYAAWSYYQLLPQSAAFSGMIVVTAGLSLIAIGRNSLRLALVALAGGYATPLLLSTGVDAQFTLFSYLLALNGGMLLISARKDWKVLEWVSFLATLTYYIGWALKFYDVTKLEPTAIWATLFFLEFQSLPVLRSRRLGTLPVEQLLLVPVNAAWYLITLHRLLEPDHRWALTLSVLALSAVHLIVVRLLPDTAKRDGQPSLSRIVFAGLALTFATLAIPIRLEGRWITIAWAIEGALLIRAGLAGRVRLLQRAGMLLVVTAAVRLLAFPIPATTFLLNGRFAVCLVVVACGGSALWFARSYADAVKPPEADLFTALGVMTNALLLWGLSLEVWQALGRQTAFGVSDVELAQHVGLSLLWVVYAAMLLVAGFRTSHAALRWQGLGLLGIAVGKAFLYDLSRLDRLYRIVSFVALGAVLLMVSFQYQRRLAVRRSRNASSPEGL